VDDTAKKTGRSRTAVARDATRAKALKDELPKLKDTSLDKGSELDALVQLKKVAPEKAAEVVHVAVARKPVRASAVLSEAQKRRIENLGENAYKRIRGTVLDAPAEIDAIIKLQTIEKQDTGYLRAR
jgi:hypothetical protein